MADKRHQKTFEHLKTFGRLIRIYAKMDLLWFMRDTKYCIAQILVDIVTSLSSVTGMLLLAQKFEGFGQISLPELKFMLGYVLLINGTFSVLFLNNNAGMISRIIGRGQLDHALIQPVPLPLHFLSNGIAPISGAGPLLCGIVLTIISVIELQKIVSVLWVIGLMGLVILSMLILMAWVYGISSMAFWMPYSAEEIADEVTDLFFTLAPYPLSGFGQIAQVVLSTALPIGAIGWLPASILLGKANAGAVALMVCVAGVFMILMLMIFRKGLRYYAKYSSPRYSGFGR